MSDKAIVFTVDGIVAQRNKEPYVRLLNDGQPVAQLTMSQARKIANDILLMASRTEADAMLVRFFEQIYEAPPAAIHALMHEFRMYRLALDEDKAEGSYSDPDTGETI